MSAARRKLWIDTTGQPVVTTTPNGERNAERWGWTEAEAVPFAEDAEAPQSPVQVAAKAMEDSRDEAVSTAAGCARVAFESIEVKTLAAAIWEASRADESTISATGANIVADAVKAHLLSE